MKSSYMCERNVGMCCVHQSVGPKPINVLRYTVGSLFWGTCCLFVINFDEFHADRLAKRMVVPLYDPPPPRSFDFGRYRGRLSWSNSSKLHGSAGQSEQKSHSDILRAYGHVRFSVEMLRQGMQGLCSVSVRTQLPCGDKSPPTNIITWRSMGWGSEHKEFIAFYEGETTTRSANLCFATYLNHSFCSVNWCTQHMPTFLNT
jgi:hypothetical protein